MARRWVPEEVNVLVDLVEENYEFLTSALSATKTKRMVEERWQIVASGVNALNAGTPYPVEKVKRKWFDLKSISKKAVASYIKELAKTGGGVNKAETSTDLQFKISEMIGEVCTEGVPGTLLCDTSLDPSKNQPANEISADQGAEAITISQTTSISPPAKRRKLIRSSRDSINHELLKEQRALVRAVGEIRDELKNISTALQKLAEAVEMKLQPQVDEENSSQLPDGFFTDLLNAE